MSCTDIVAEQNAAEAEASQLTGVIRQNRKHNQVFGYLGGLFIFPAVAARRNPGEKERLDHIFERYYSSRTDSAPDSDEPYVDPEVDQNSHAHAHHGIGLWIVRRNVEAIGGRVVAEGTPADIVHNPASLTGQYLSGRRAIPLPDERVAVDEERLLRLHGASGNNLRDIDVDIPLGVLTCITGVSGSGKSTLINDTLYAHVARALNNAATDPAPCASLEGLDQIDRVIAIHFQNGERSRFDREINSRQERPITAAGVDREMAVLAVE